MIRIEGRILIIYGHGHGERASFVLSMKGSVTLADYCAFSGITVAEALAQIQEESCEWRGAKWAGEIAARGQELKIDGRGFRSRAIAFGDRTVLSEGRKAGLGQRLAKRKL